MSKLSAAQRHVLSRCSTADRWDRSGRGFPRQWPDLMHGRSRCAFSTVKALVAKGLLYEDDDWGGFGLTRKGYQALISIGLSPTPAREEGE